MELTQNLIDEVVDTAKGLEYGRIIIAISGPPDNKVVDITAERRKRYKGHVTPEGIEYQSDIVNTA